MNTLNDLFGALGSIATSPILLLVILLGVVLGTVAGLLPGVGPSTSIALLLPVAITLPAELSLPLMVSLYLGAEYGGRISAILLNIPGDPGAIMTTLDGHPMALKGKAATALSISALASFLGSILAFLGLAFLAGPMSQLGLAFGPAVYFSVVVMALVLSATLVGSAPMLGLTAVALGVAMSTIGIELQSGLPRFTFGSSTLLEGIEPIVAIIGVFGIGEILASTTMSKDSRAISSLTGRFFPTGAELKQGTLPGLRGSIIGFIAGVLPGAGATIAAFFSYGLEKRLAPASAGMGKGAVRGLVAPEAANNAAVSGSMVPLLTLGIPGSGTTAVLLAYLMMYGLNPGPGFFEANPVLGWTIIGALLVSAIFGMIINIGASPLLAKILAIPMPFMAPTILMLALISCYSIHNSVTDVYIALAFGALGYVMRLVGMSPALLVIGIVLGEMLERNLQQALGLTGGDFWAMISQPLVLLFLGIAVLALLTALPWKQMVGKRLQGKSKSDADDESVTR
ncbi:tripartite tricarboxylate transporter permease [Brevibacterium aurantiacum]|uniref:Tricarboxylic transport membrane protein n=1 Tax=Brevibacterium aurantiacum TaxID=273384 RepID=A0A2H1KBT4_BREAU|nr:tripartite tricarboxylate transporter permease [Brevibacterium aurantiacum]GEB24599.1 tripartite tricarboxylate transporter TctA [Brevibacterium aurantiacum]SMX97241.1 putative tricarboxylic transport membrane protein [Brevibacterium aurantiacum]